MAQAVPFGIASRATDIDPDDAGNELLKGARVLYGWSIGESAGTSAVAEILIKDGLDDTGEIVGVVELAANGAETQWFERGLRIQNGIYVDRVAGEYRGALYVG